MKLLLICDSITSNIYSLKDIYSENIKRIVIAKQPSTWGKITPFGRYLIDKTLLEQVESYAAICGKIRDKETLNFGYGL